MLSCADKFYESLLKAVTSKIRKMCEQSVITLSAENIAALKMLSLEMLLLPMPKAVRRKLFGVGTDQLCPNCC
jgi:hypothetical protein